MTDPTMTPEDQSRSDLEAIAQIVGDLETDARGRKTYSFDSWGLEAFAREVLAASRRTERASSEWQPIETAPKDGTWLLVAGPTSRTGARRMVCRWSDEWESADDGYGAYINPTHWMPLPEAPALAVETKEG